MRNPNRLPGGIRRPDLTRPTPSTRPASNLLLRTAPVSTPLLSVRRRKHQTVGGPSREWASTPYLRPTSAAMTRAWDATVSNRP